MLITSPLRANPLRDTITNAYRMDETKCVNLLIPYAKLPPESLAHISETAKKLVSQARAQKMKGNIDLLLHQYNLSTEEGVALMCLAEALLRIPDKDTQDKLISDKLSTADWKTHLNAGPSLFVNAATWSLLLTGKIYAPTLNQDSNLLSSLKRASSRLGIAVIRPLIFQMMKTIGNQFVLGETIESAINKAQKLEKMGYTFSYDMLGESAHTAQDALHYYDIYRHAINTVGKLAKDQNPAKNPGVSIKLSALHPRYEFIKYDQVMQELVPIVVALAQLAKQHNIGLVIDAEEADRLDLSLDIFQTVYLDQSLAGWEGLGLALQAYQKRTFYVIDWLIELARTHNKRIFTRLVKGAYWDAEIKTSQMLGLSGYPVFTRRAATDVSYLACAKKLLANDDLFYPQFGTHNAYSIAAIMAMAGKKRDFEFQCLYGMGRPLYDQIVAENDYACRIYAPVGSHQDLLGYLVRRLLENGANSSFINQLADTNKPLENIIADPVARLSAVKTKPHPRIPLPKDIYKDWQNSSGIDLSNRHELLELKRAMDKADNETNVAAPIIDGQVQAQAKSIPALSPNNNAVVGEVSQATEAQIEAALSAASTGRKDWRNTEVNERATILERAAALIQANMPAFITLLVKEEGKCILDAIAETREAIDYCRYYAYRAREDLKPQPLPGPTGEANQLCLYPRGVIVCISPWNFPLAIFLGQVVAALVTGNTVIAKPAEQTPLIAFKAIQLLHEAGIPKQALQFLPGTGEEVGAKLVSDDRVAGVMFTGGTSTARLINQSLANREGPIPFFIGETGGQNAMIVDSSALPEQAVIDIATSAFNSAGQRCSALRVLFVQEEIAPKLLTMLAGYMSQLALGNPKSLSTDIGPVIDKAAREMLDKHVNQLKRTGSLIAQIPNSPLAGEYFSPCAFEISDLAQLKREVFGPILHVIRYNARNLDQVLQAIINTGYGLTLGINSRIEATVQFIASQMPVGNIYVNRNMIGAVVGVQPFGGERLSGTGPKAGGPHYLPRLCVERSVSTNTTAVGGNASLVSLLEDD